MTPEAPAGRARSLGRVLTGPGGRLALSLAVVVAVFAFALPQIADYSSAWRLIRAMAPGEVGVLVAVGIVNLLSYAALWVAGLPGLRWRDAVMVEETSTMVSNTVPGGFAFGVGTIAAMYTSVGHAPGVIARAVAVTGIWNNLVKLAAPVVAVVALTATGDATAGLASAAWIGLAALLLAVGVLVLAVHSAHVARALGRGAQAVAAPVLRALHRGAPHDWADSADHFRAESETLVRHRWLYLTVAAVGSHGMLFVVLLTALRFVGSDVSWPRVLAVFALTRLVTLVPITPGAVGVAELSYVAGLTAVGVPAAEAAGAVLVFRFLTWLLPIPVGAVCWLLWRRRAGRHARDGIPQLSAATP